MRKLFLLGDSTCACKDGDKRPETGWGEMLQPLLADGWTVANHAVNGLSTRTCLSRGIFACVEAEAAAGDGAIIQFGHNDEKVDDAERGTEPWSSFMANLAHMASTLKGKGVYTVIATPIPRRKFIGGIMQDTHGDYAAAAKAAAHQAGVPCVDATLPAMLEYQRMGEDSRRFHMDFAPGIYPNYPDGDADGTHLRPEGAAYYASLIMRLVGEEDAGAPFLR